MEAVQLDISGALAEAVGERHGITASEWRSVQEPLRAAQEALQAQRRRGELGFAELPGNEAQLALMLPVAQQVRYRYDHIVVLGIGGSSLGLRCLTEALLNPSETSMDRMDRRSMPRLIICDNVDPDQLGPLFQQIDWAKTCINVVSKSGKTAETAAQFLIAREHLERRFGSERWKDHVIITTDPTSGPLRALAVCDNIHSFAVPPSVGGRFACLSPVALFPAACAGVDIARVLAGARHMAERCGQADVEANPAAQLAAVQYLLNTKHGKTVHVLMPYAVALRRFGEWGVQLLAESLGKGGRGPTPLCAIGTTDQHSQLQLFVDGPNDKLLSIYTVDQFNCSVRIPASDEPAFRFLGTHELSHLLNAEAAATRQVLKEAQRPSLHLRLPRISPEVLGQLVFCYEWMTALAGELYGVNAFDQPAVERGKVLTREILEGVNEFRKVAR